MVGMDQHENGAIAVSRVLRDAGMEVIYGGTFNTPETIVRACEDEDIDLVGISTHSWEYLNYVPDIIRSLKSNDLRAKVVVGGSIITSSDVAKLKEMGVSDVFVGGTSEKRLIDSIRELGGN